MGNLVENVDLKIMGIELPYDPAICRDVDGPRVCHTEWNVRKRKTNIILLTRICGI